MMMRKAILLLLIICALSISCSTTKKTIHGGNSITASEAGNDGSSYDKAIFVHEDHERPGIDYEYAWIRNKYPGSKVNGQSLNYHDKKPYDIIHITTADNAALDVYFDISNFYGKF